MGTICAMADLQSVTPFLRFGTMMCLILLFLAGHLCHAEDPAMDLGPGGYGALYSHADVRVTQDNVDGADLLLGLMEMSENEKSAGEAKSQQYSDGKQSENAKSNGEQHGTDGSSQHDKGLSSQHDKDKSVQKGKSSQHDKTKSHEKSANEASSSEHNQAETKQHTASQSQQSSDSTSSEAQKSASNGKVASDAKLAAAPKSSSGQGTVPIALGIGIVVCLVGAAMGFAYSARREREKRDASDPLLATADHPAAQPWKSESRRGSIFAPPSEKRDDRRKKLQELFAKYSTDGHMTYADVTEFWKLKLDVGLEEEDEPEVTQEMWQELAEDFGFSATQGMEFVHFSSMLEDDSSIHKLHTKLVGF